MVERAIDRPVFSIRSVPVCGDLILAPMDGFTDWPFRVICRELGSAMSYTEFINVDEIIHARRAEGAIKLKLKFSESERPVAFQIYGHVDERLVETARALQDRGPDVIDINLGCAIRKIAERGAGAGMLKDPARLGRLFAALTTAVQIPVTAKIRLGWDDRSRNYLEVARALEDNGCALIAVHARTKEQGLSGPADWSAIAEIKSRAGIPILGNGNVHTVADIDAIQRETKCDGVMIGRGAIGHPWIFSRRDKESVLLPESVSMARRHLGMMMEIYGSEFGCRIFRKHAVRYVHHLVSVGKLRSRLGLCSNVAEYESLFAEAIEIEKSTHL
jgi:tRNA-dihydrouridine synthase B